MFIKGCCLEENYKEILKMVLTEGKTRHVRGFNTVEISPFIYTTSTPLQNIITNKTRKLNRAFSVAEFMWILSGRNDLEMISTYNKNISTYSDNGAVFNGAYGPMIRQQLDNVISLFNSDLYTRQGVISIWKVNPSLSKDIPCTISMQFLVNHENKLDLITTMRSNDAWLGFPYDIYNFTMIQNYLAMKLNVPLGRYTHQAGSFHLYQEHYEKAYKLSKENTFLRDIKESKLFVKDELFESMLIESYLRKNKDCNESIYNLTDPWKSMIITLKNYLDAKT